MQKISVFGILTALLILTCVSQAQTIQTLVHQAPDGAQLTFQLTDGTVMAQGYNDSDWWRLTPDNKGSYLDGTWTQLASLPSGYSPEAFASAVLADGRLLIEGGEYNFGNFTLTNLGAVYNPKSNVWTALQPPPGWSFIGDSPSSMLPNGTFLIGDKLVKNVAALNPKTMKWVQGNAPGKSDFNAEEGWTLMPDRTVLTADVKNAPNSERFFPTMKKWETAGSTIVDLHSPSPYGCLPFGPNNQYCYYPPGEIGPAILRPDGTVFATGSYTSTGAPAHTAIYTPGAHLTDPGTWTAGPNFPNGDDAGDSFAVLQTNGDVLVEGESGDLYTFDGTNFTAGLFAGGSLMVLPTGQVLIGGSEIYTPTGTYSPEWAPSITNYPASVTRGSTYKISGTQFNGLSQANAFGDEYQTATNYPLVRITNNASGHVFYAATHDHSSMGVATGNATVSTNFDVPAGMETGASSLVVVANGIPSVPVSITVN
ncbi:MAG: kelch repeat-containing protein [Terriglobales bacterium]